MATPTAPHILPVDATQTKAWCALTNHYAKLKDTKATLKKWFAEDPQRVQNLTFKLDQFLIDLSKNLATQETLDLLCDLAQEVKLEERRDAMYAGEHINTTENRAVLHTALRRPASEAGTLIVDGQDVVADVQQTLNKMYAFCDRVRSGEWKGVTGKPIKTVVSIGIGGSDLGPVMVYEALKPFADAGITARFVSNIDPVDLGEKTKDLDPETTLFIIVSKTFTTLETLTNARCARAWLLEKLAERGVIFGPEHFAEFLSGFNAVDEYFKNTPLRQNVVALMGLLNVWYVNFFGAASHAVLPYSQYLHRFPAYLQQLTMESNGKSTRWDGSAVTSNTGEIFWGEAGTNGQHAFYQLIHQGTQIIPADFIAFANTAFATKDADLDVHELFLSNFFAQTKALAFGKTADEVRAEGTPEWMVSARVFEGNRPTTSIFGKELNPRAVGTLIALYEHITFNS